MQNWVSAYTMLLSFYLSSAFSMELNPGLCAYKASSLLLSFSASPVPRMLLHSIHTLHQKSGKGRNTVGNCARYLCKTVYLPAHLWVYIRIVQNWTFNNYVKLKAHFNLFRNFLLQMRSLARIIKWFKFTYQDQNWSFLNSIDFFPLRNTNLKNAI